MADNEPLISKIKNAFVNKDFRKLKKIYDDLVNLILIEQNKMYVELAVVVYALSKMLTKPRYYKEKFEESMKAIEKAMEKIENEGINEKNVNELKETIKKTELIDRRFVLDMIIKGQLKTASLLYAKGLSLSATSKLTGIIKEEILSYAGKTMMFERIKEEKNVRKRLEIAKKLLLSD